MKIICSSSMPYAREAFSTLGEVELVEGRSISPAHVKDADILAVRSTTPINRALLSGSSVRFVGTATIGTDHIDQRWIEESGIFWMASPGCNATSVGEYITAALLHMACRHGWVLSEKTIGIIGVGHVGTKVAERCRALGMNVLLNDPPRHRVSGSKEFIPLSDMLKQADILTLHVPLEKDGQDPTWHLVNDLFLEHLKPGACLINSARGSIIDNDQLIEACGGDTLKYLILDTWEGEPCVRKELLGAVSLGTPHIAGYSFEGKAMGTDMVYRAACEFLGQEPVWNIEDVLPAPPVPFVMLDAADKRFEESLHEVVSKVYDIASDSESFLGSQAGTDQERSAAFDRHRNDYPVRREFRYTTVEVKNGTQHLLNVLSMLGFKILS
jgi:erythronate-4-phosphate dehydrogenase